MTDNNANKTEMTLAEALLLRKELNMKVDRLTKINVEEMFKTRVERGRCQDGFNEMIAKVPRVAMTQITHAFDWHAKRLRQIDAAIQQANHMTKVTVDADVAKDYVDPYVDVAEGQIGLISEAQK